MATIVDLQTGSITNDAGYVDTIYAERFGVPADVPKVALVRAMRLVGLDGSPANPVKAWTIVKGALAEADEETQEDWELSTRIPRNYQAITDIATALSVPSEALDAVFILARQIDVAG